jgi:hypothetical protein
MGLLLERKGMYGHRDPCHSGRFAHRFSESIAARFREQTAFELKSKIRSSPIFRRMRLAQFNHLAVTLHRNRRLNRFEHY